MAMKRLRKENRKRKDDMEKRIPRCGKRTARAGKVDDLSVVSGDGRGSWWMAERQESQAERKKAFTRNDTRNFSGTRET